jgi:hypothetical protein
MAKPLIITPASAELAKQQRDHDRMAERQYGRTLRYDRNRHALHVTLRSGVEVVLPIDKIKELAKATREQLAEVKLIPTGGALEQRELDVDLSLPGLLRDVMGFELQQRRAARAKSPAKAAAARVNGAKGGRPPTVAYNAPTYTPGFAASAGAAKKSASGLARKKSVAKKSSKRR